jgi:hypothetical protein
MPSGQALCAPKSRTPSTRRLKATEIYTYDEAARVLGVYKAAVRRWGRQGLRIDTSGRPHLIRGDELIRFCKERQTKRRQKCSLSEFYCLKCRKPSKPYEMTTDLKIKPNGRLALSSICAVCETRVFKTQSVKSLSKIVKALSIQKVEGKHLLDCIDPSLKSHLDGHI